MTLTKRIVAGVICLALFIAALVFGIDTPSVTIGRGSGRAAQIATLEDLNDVLRSLETSSLTEDISPLAASSAADAAEEAAKYTSFHFVEETDAFYDQTQTQSSGDQSYERDADARIRRTLQMGYTENAVYYRSEGEIITRSSSVRRETRRIAISDDSYRTYTIREEEDISESMIFTMEIYVEEDAVFIRADRFRYTYEREYRYTDEYNPDNNVTETESAEDDPLMTALQENPGVWIDCTAAPQIAGAFISINDTNIQTLSSIGDMIEEAVTTDADFFEERNGRYSMDEEGFYGVSGLVVDEETDYSIDFVIDLSDQTTPNISLRGNGKIVDKQSSSWGSSRRDMVSDVTEAITFRNINNTTVNFTGAANALDIADLVDEEDL